MRALRPFFLLLICLRTLTAQDLQLTSGPSDELNASFSRSFGYVGYDWLVFERQTDDSSFIVGKRYLMPKGEWDSTEVIIARSSQFERLKYPDVSITNDHVLVGWQQFLQGRWKIHYRRFSYARSSWSTAVLLTTDTLSATNVRIHPIKPDSQFMMMWKSGTAIRYARVGSGLTGTKDTVAVMGSDSTEFDMISDRYERATVAWSIQGEGGASLIVQRDLILNITDSLGRIDTLKTNRSAERPRYIATQYGSQRILFESPRSGNSSDLFLQMVIPSYLYPTTPFRVTDSTRSGYNARGYFNPVVIIQYDQMTVDKAPYNHLIAYQVSKHPSVAHLKDSSYIRITTGLSSDSIASAGSERNPIVGSKSIMLKTDRNGLYVPVVWESNRTGRFHLYSRNSLVDYIYDAPYGGNIPDVFTLYQNYPNPFNPSTTIRYHVAAAGLVSVTVHDVLGRIVSTLVDRQHAAGDFEVTFYGEKLSSGVYFCRMQAGTFVQTRKLSLLK